MEIKNMESIFSNSDKFSRSYKEKFTPEETKNIAKEISILQGSVGGWVEQRSPEKMAELIDKKLVFFLRNDKKEIVASFYLDPFMNDGQEVYILGGLSSKEIGIFSSLKKKAMEIIMNDFKDKTIFARTKPRIAKLFLSDMGFQKISEEEFNLKYKDDYIKYMSVEVPNFNITEGVDTYLREKSIPILDMADSLTGKSTQN